MVTWSNFRPFGNRTAARSRGWWPEWRWVPYNCAESISKSEEDESMRRYALRVLGLVALMASAPALGADYSIAAASGAPAEDQFGADILKQIGSQGIKVAKGKRTLLEFWPAREWVVKPGFKPSAEVLYPFELGQLVGVAQYKSKATDFRGQEIKPGAYTVRYGQQPVDGNHVGTAPTRDFFLLLPAGEDRDPVVLEKETLFKESADAAESSHPAILYMQ